MQVADFGFIKRDRFFLQLKRIHAAGVQGTDHTASAGARNHRGRETIGFQHLDHANMRETLGCTAA